LATLNVHTPKTRTIKYVKTKQNCKEINVNLQSYLCRIQHPSLNNG
jgi:hypothetical protein